MKPFRLALEWFLNPDHVPFLVGQELGWFKDVGLDLELIEPQEHLDAAEMMARGEIEAAITEPLHLVHDVAEGQDQVGFARFLHTNGGVMYFKGKGIERPRDLLGKRLQYPGAPGPGGRAIAQTMIEADGGSVSGEVIIPVNNSFYHTNALAEDKADAATLVFYNFEVIEARHRGFAADFFALKDWGVPDFCQLILITSNQLLESDEESYRSLVKVLRRAVDLVKQEPRKAQEIYNARAGVDASDELGRAIYDATTACFTHDFSMSDDYYKELEAWMVRTAQAPTAGHTYWTNRIAF